MDPISAAGLGLGVTSLCLQVFSGCIKGHELFTEMAEMPENYKAFRTKLRIEESRLLNWGEQVGLLEELLTENSKTLNLQHNLVLEVLLEMHAAFRSCLKVTDQLDLHVSSELVLPTVASKKQRDFVIRARSIWAAKNSAGVRLKWAMIRQDQFEKLVDRLKGFSDHMESLLDRHSLRQLHSMQTKSNLLLLQLTEQVAQLHTLAQNFSNTKNASEARFSLSRSTTLISEGAQDDDFSRLIEFKAQNLAMNEDKHEIDFRIPTAALAWAGDVSFHDRTMAKMNGDPVWIEWHQTSDQVDDAHHQIIKSRLSKLAYLLNNDKPPAGFRAPRCLGYCHHQTDEEEQAFGLVYALDNPRHSQQSPPQSLRQLISSQPTPSLSTRITLAVQLTESLMYLHAVNWLHKGLRSANILFLPHHNNNSSSPSKTNHPTTLSNPTISGFEFSRPDTENTTTIKSTTRLQDDYYRHPDLLATGTTSSTKADDIYALGLILIEIALWKPIEDIIACRTGKKISRSVVVLIREQLLGHQYRAVFERDVAAAVGDVYAAAVRRCIQGGEALGLPACRSDAKKGPQIDSDLQAVFYDEVFLKLKGIQA